ncbi:hypothetical protein Bhyg_13080 [Pseudolycoriella hygida]|uniref:Uncharacterized protein n=1 Tax=Pseudolycoriella hygida TaxID=35572 RepID=A0A9Q0MYM0_9DIPT|nr:hypothetical protein Bhyg_13080 [Pseudolycoriella hygida]
MTTTFPIERFVTVAPVVRNRTHCQMSDEECANMYQYKVSPFGYTNTNQIRSNIKFSNWDVSVQQIKVYDIFV